MGYPFLKKNNRKAIHILQCSNKAILRSDEGVHYLLFKLVVYEYLLYKARHGHSLTV